MGGKQNEAKKCLFCGGGKLSKEHIWSDWMKKILPPTPSHGQQVFHSLIDNQNNRIAVQPYMPEVRQGAQIQRKLRNVCRKCNSGWMGGIVERAKPFAELLILDRPVHLNARAQTNLAAWIAIASIMAELTDVPTAGIPPGDYEIVMRTEAPPQDWTICLGRYAGTAYAPTRYRHHGMGFYYEPSVPRPDAVVTAAADKVQFTTYTLGALLVHAFSSTRADISLRLRDRYTPANMVRIWPRTSDLISWPSSPVLGDGEVKTVADGGYLGIVRAGSV